MIDAYEIGIQLLLQDDVSAGLAVVNQGLAEVDRAIAATNANLAGLIQEANAATRAVAAATSKNVGPTAVQTRVAAVEDANSGTAPSPNRATESFTTQTPTRQQQSVEPGFREEANSHASEPAIAPVVAAGTTEIDRPAEPTLPRDPISPALPAAQVVAKSVEPATAPVVGPPTVMPDRLLPSPNTRPTFPVESLAPSRTARLEQGVNEFPSAGVVRATSSVLATPVAVTASINEFQRSSEASNGQAALRSTAPRQEATRQERPVAPGSSVEQKERGSAISRPSDESDMSPPSIQDRGERTGGNVMLDGRLVGQWLAEHMGREASKPPGGTTFFDPRQTPAWNISGAL